MPPKSMPTFSRVAYEYAIARFPDRPRIMSEGDSWFSYPLTANLVRRLNLIETKCNWLRLEHSGDDMLDIIADQASGNALDEGTITGKIGYQEKRLIGLLSRATSRPDVLLLSAGGNDIIGEGRRAQGSDPGRPGLRNFLVPHADFVRAGGKPEHAVNQAIFQGTLNKVDAAFRHIVALREEAGASSTWIVCHTYCTPQPRNVKGPLGIGPWMYPSFNEKGYRGSPNIMFEVMDWMLGEFRKRLRLLSKDLKHFLVVDLTTKTFVLQPADPKSPKAKNGMWNDEIHPTDEGYERLAQAFLPFLQKRFKGYFT